MKIKNNLVGHFFNGRAGTLTDFFILLGLIRAVLTGTVL